MAYHTRQSFSKYYFLTAYHYIENLPVDFTITAQKENIQRLQIMMCIFLCTHAKSTWNKKKLNVDQKIYIKLFNFCDFDIFDVDTKMIFSHE